MRPSSFGKGEQYAYAGATAVAVVRPRGIVVQLSRAVMVGPIARLELIPADDNKPSGGNGDSIVEAQILAQQYRDMGFREGETLVVTPRRARVFLEGAAPAGPMSGEEFDPVV